MKHLSKSKQLRRRECNRKKKEYSQSTKQYWKARARLWLHKWIREVRDKDNQCISCGKVFSLGEKSDAGHFHSDGGHAALRYDERNIHRQCVRCNQHLSGNIKEYVKHLPERIGQEAFDWLDAHQNDIKSWSIEELKEIAKKYEQLCKNS